MNRRIHLAAIGVFALAVSAELQGAVQGIRIPITVHEALTRPLVRGFDLTGERIVHGRFPNPRRDTAWR